jgi:L-fucose mutarotase
MLKTLDPALTPDLLWALAAMGHGDILAVVDANYPAHALHSRVITLVGVDMAQAITAIGSVFPVDQVVEPAVRGMVPDNQPDQVIGSHQKVATALTAAESRSISVAPLERSKFYDEAKKAFAVILTGERSSYACFLITKGVVNSG